MSVTQFISRVDRPYDVNSTLNTAPGPGTYNDQRGFTKAMLPGFAPFAVSSKRHFAGSDVMKDVPAPGSYELEKSIVPPSSSTASAFRSKAKRFEDVPEFSAGLGPGEWYVNWGWGQLRGDRHSASQVEEKCYMIKLELVRRRNLWGLKGLYAACDL